MERLHRDAKAWTTIINTVVSTVVGFSNDCIVSIMPHDRNAQTNSLIVYPNARPCVSEVL